MGEGADLERNRYQQGTRDTVKMQVPPRLRVQSGKLHCVSGFQLPVCKARTSLPDSVTVVLPPNRVRLFFAPREGSAARGGRARGAGAASGVGAGPWGVAPLPAPRSPGPSPAARRTKRLPLPPPTAAFQKGGGRRARGSEEEEGWGEKVLPAGLGWIAPWREGRREERGEGLGSLGEPGGGKDS